MNNHLTLSSPARLDREMAVARVQPQLEHVRDRRRPGRVRLSLRRLGRSVAVFLLAPRFFP